MANGFTPDTHRRKRCAHRIGIPLSDREWALFILANREAGRTGFRHPYDIVIGPIADDGVAFQLERYVRNLISLDVLVKELTYKRLNRQYYFGTEAALSKLEKL